MTPTRKPRPETSTALKTALWFWLFLGLSQLAIGLCLDYVNPDFRFPEAANVLRRARSSSRAPDILFLGTSRFKGDVNPAELERLLAAEPGTLRPVVFNAAVAAGDPLAQEGILNRLLALGWRPKLVVFEISPDTLSYRTNWLTAHIARQFTWPQVIRSLPYAFDNGSIAGILSARLLPLYKYRQELLEWISGVPPPLISVPAAASGERSAAVAPLIPPDQAARTENKLNRFFSEFRVAGMPPEALERMLKTCRLLGIRPVLVSAPVRSDVRIFYGRYNVGPTYLSYVEHVCRIYECRHVDAGDWLPDAQFVDIYHPTWEGGLTFSRTLAQKFLVEAWHESARR